MLGVKTKKARSSANNWWEQAEEVPRAGLPSADKQRKRARWWRVYVWASLVLLPLALVGVVVTAGASGSGSAVTAEAGPDKFSETRSVALVAVREWLAGDPSPVPGGEVVGWDSATSSTWKPAEGTDPDLVTQGKFRQETHRVTLSAPGGAMFVASVLVLFDEAHGAVVASSPSLAPVLPADSSWAPNPYPDLDETTPTEDVVTAVSAWVDAYASGDPSLLHQTVGDTDASHSYLPLSGARLRDPVADEAWVVSLVPAEEGTDRVPDSVIVRVSARIDWAVAPIEDANEAPEVTFDVLVESANTAAPRVVAWGGPGEGAHLKRHGNAITSRTVAAVTGDATFEDGDPSEQSDPSGEETLSPPDDVTDPDEGTGTETAPEPDPEAETDTGLSKAEKKEKRKARKQAEKESNR